MGQNIRHFDIILSWRSRGDKIVIVSETGTLEMGFYYHSTSCVVSRIKLDFSKNGQQNRDTKLFRLESYN